MVSSLSIHLHWNISGVSWCCGNYCWLAFVLWCGCCSVSFQSFVLRHWCPQQQETTNISKEKKKVVPPIAHGCQ